MPNNEYKISVIMPVYNVAEYLPKAIESVLNQSYNNFEFFLIDDGSTDNSGEICDEYAKRHSNIKVIHQKNSGAHRARNSALELASGDYVCFFDSDDYVDRNMLEDLLNVAIEYKSDLIISGFYINTYYDSNKYIVLNYIPCTTNNLNIENFNNNLDFRKNSYLNFDRNMFYPPWNKMYKLSYLKDNKITFPITYRDDFPFVLNVIKDIDNVTYVKKQYYHFLRKRSDSETQKYVENLYEKREEEHYEMLALFSYWGLNEDKNSMEMISRRYIDRVLECMVNLFNDECKLSNNEKELMIGKYLHNTNFTKCINIARPNKLYLKIIYFVLKRKNIYVCYLMAKFINFVKKNNIKLFSILKTNR